MKGMQLKGVRSSVYSEISMFFTPKSLMDMLI